jgi:hypothetical protein
LENIGKNFYVMSQKPAAIQVLEKQTWEQCTAAQCVALDPNAPWWMRYGAANQYRYRLVIGASVTCSWQWFGSDPYPGQYKFCYKSSQPFMEIVGASGDWIVNICGGGCNQEVSIETGVTQHTASQLTTSFATSLETSAKASYGFGGVSMTATVSEEVVRSSIQAFDRSVVQTVTVSCSDPTDEAMWRYSTAAVERNLFSGADRAFQVGSSRIWCVSRNWMKPKCIPGYCQDEDCQVCIPAMYSDSVPVAGEPAEPHYVVSPIILVRDVPLSVSVWDRFIDVQWKIVMALSVIGSVLLSAALYCIRRCCCNCDCYFSPYRRQQKKGFQPIAAMTTTACEDEIVV